MRYSEVQEELWRIRDELGRRMATMTLEERHRMLDAAVRDFEQETGKTLEVVDRRPVRQG